MKGAGEFEDKILPSRLGLAGCVMGGSSLSEELLSEAESDPVFIFFSCVEYFGYELSTCVHRVVPRVQSRVLSLLRLHPTITNCIF